MTRVNEDVVCAEEFNRELFVGMCSGDAQDSIPATFGVQEFAGIMSDEELLELPAIFPDALQELWLEQVTLAEKSRKSPLCRRAEREVSIRDDLQAIQGSARKPFRPRNCDPGNLHLWKRGNLAEPTQRERKHFVICGEAGMR